MKKVLFVLSTILMLTVIIVGATLSSSAEVIEGTCGAEGNENNVTWSIDTEKYQLTISGQGEMSDYSEINPAPWTQVIRNIRSTVTLVIDEGITNVGEYAFYDTHLSRATISGSVKTIEKSAFEESSLRCIELEEGVTEIHEMAFWNTPIAVIIIPKSVSFISDSIIPLSYLHQEVPNRVQIIYGGSEDEFENKNWQIFSPCQIHYNYLVHDEYTAMGGETLGIFELDLTTGKAVVWGDIAHAGYSDKLLYIRQYIKQVYVCDGVTRVGDFRFCTNLKSISIPKSVTLIGNFTNCKDFNVYYRGTYDDLSSLTVDFHDIRGWWNLIPTSFGDDGDNLTWSFDDLTGELTISGTGRCRLRRSLVEDHWYVLCNQIKTVIIQEGVTSIDSREFMDCNNLTSIIIPNSVTSIGYDAFKDCNRLIQNENGVSYVDK